MKSLVLKESWAQKRFFIHGHVHTPASLLVNSCCCRLDRCGGCTARRERETIKLNKDSGYYDSSHKKNCGEGMMLLPEAGRIDQGFQAAFVPCPQLHCSIPL
jgi:hypothetical protein